MIAPFGEKIKNAWKISGLTQKEFAEKLNMSVRNAQNLFERNDFSIQQLISISKVLNEDFVSMYLNEYKSDNSYPSNAGAEEPKAEYQVSKAPKNEVSVQVNIKGDFTLLSKYFPELISKFKKDVEDRGLSLG